MSNRLEHPIPRAAMRTMSAPILASALALLGGCVANSSNPRVSIGGATASQREAAFDLDLSNPGGRDLVVTAIEYQLAHGEMAFPVAEGSWSGDLSLPAGETRRLALRIPFTVEPMEADSRRLHLSGTLRTKDRTGYLGLKFMDLTATPFQAEVDASPQSAGSNP
jgi:hypothetical protein